nr:death-associated protein kinase 1-like [Desmodus rotundus]
MSSFCLEEAYEIQLNQGIFWLRFLKSLVPGEEPSVFFLRLISSFIALWSKKIPDMISIFSKFILCPNMQSTLENVPCALERQLLSMETPRALHHHRGHHTVEDGQHLRAGSGAEERLQVLDARDVCAWAVSSRTLVDLGVLMKTHNL